ncbi:calcium-transporting ATPase [Blastocystis sp. subtype 4]|uniref:calcium-transporting ATPase n=1 Tax=Blastocystis sp. subtype 4 TaxID=944170 RepID=UPI0007122B4D|nr:calcium-transporting ATPase [Blastocystis sp. subtype 4]KNB44679.1 calcium-transporting ATPase [Blastocystis sp. subtype 4]|eukprot:XP_014528120.1 calcium-transporting ATPase [Blastocystis sp. subtype 4]
MNPNADNPVQVDGTHGDAVTSGKQPETQSDSLGANPAPKVVNASTEAGIEMTEKGGFELSPEVLGAPTAQNKDSLFDWQMEGDGPKTVDRFGGVNKLVESLHSNVETVSFLHGLTTEQANDPKRIEFYGSNKPEERKGATYWELIWDGLHDLTLIILICAAIVSIILGAATEGLQGCYDGLAILLAVVIVLNVTAINDLQKDKQFRQLNAINNRRNIKVKRDGKMVTVVTDDLVVGDIVQISAGDTVPADGIYISGNNMKMDESKLTGESDQVEKGAKNPFIVSSSECHDGSCLMVVTAVGPNSVFGRMKTMIEGDNEEQTPLQAKLDILSKQITILGFTVGVLTIIVIIAKYLFLFFTGKGTVDDMGNPSWKTTNWLVIVNAFVIGITILVVAIPEGLPLAVTIALAYSVKRMMTDNNLVRHLNACETMGGANTIWNSHTESNDCEDQAELLNTLKTGDQEEYNAFIAKCKSLPEVPRMLLLENALLNNDAFLTTNADNREVGVGSAIEVAMLKWARLLGVNYLTMREQTPQLKQDDGSSTGILKFYPFHSDRKRSSCLVRLSNGKYRLYVKGAPEMVLRLCDRLQYSVDGFKELTGDFQEVEGKVTGEGSRRRIVENCIYPMARQALRVIAFAYRDFETAQDWDEMVTYRTEEQKGLTLVGLLGFQDPVRPEVPGAVRDCQKAGIFVRMVTGDNMETAKAIARQCNIYNSKGYVDGQGKHYPAGRAILGSQFREITGGLVLPPHFYHKCDCKDCSADPYFVPGFKTPDYPTHYGYPSIVGHKDEHCKDWTPEAVAAVKERISVPRSARNEDACTK